MRSSTGPKSLVIKSASVDQKAWGAVSNCGHFGHRENPYELGFRATGEGCVCVVVVVVVVVVGYEGVERIPQ